MWGVSLKSIQKIYGNEIKSYFMKEIKKWEVKKYVVCRSNVYSLTPQGKIFADNISSDLFIVS